MMNDRENTLRAARFEGPERIPVSFAISSGCWERYPQETLQELMAEHPLLFPDFQKADKILPTYAPWRRAGEPYTDSWWAALSSYVPPSPEEHDGWGPIEWDEIRKNVSTAWEKGHLAAGSLRHGHTFLTLTYLRGYKNLIFDMADEHPQLLKLIAVVEAFNLGLVRRYIKAGVEWMGYPEDLGMQQGPMLSPRLFRQYIKPTYQRLVAPARDGGCVIHMHSDGDIRELTEDLLEIGIDVLNLQDLVNGIDWIEANLKNRACIDLDLDRQSLTRFGSPDQIDNHIREVVERLGSRKGGLMLKYGLYPGVPLENVRAVMDAMETYSQRFS
jgi:uroporphyrinogen-III decarboxylase